MSQLVFLIIGIAIGYFIGMNRKQESTKEKRTKAISYTERQKAKVRYENDSDRIRQINLLSPNESKFMRMLQHEFTNQKVITKGNRFYIADLDDYPIAIFEYRDGTKQIKSEDKEDGIPIFIYKSILSSEKISKDKEKLNII
ncbi:hypothetical protein [Acinetobacter gyllenbergii]|uniref:hypothetical protein n=1 Tax=Acinetobacter gyllenbergii TaxID=134534 RepID=UPI00241FF592|nr:hypothetical protein [Acinetobacter gyllenbergii]